MSRTLKLVIVLLTSCVKFKAKRCLKDTVSTTPLMGEIRKDLFHQKWCDVFLQTKMHSFLRGPFESVSTQDTIIAEHKFRTRRHNLPEHDMVSSLDPCKTPSQVWTPAEDLTGIVPSPDSIFVRSCPGFKREFKNIKH